jgi:hypothetical protein
MKTFDTLNLPFDGSQMKYFKQYLVFFFNGVMLGLAAWALQFYLYNFIGSGSSAAYALATSLTYVIFVLINCTIQRYLIFRTKVIISRFILSQVFMMVFLTLLSPLSMLAINKIAGISYGERFGFAVAAVSISIPSYLLSRFWAFQERSTNSGF